MCSSLIHAAARFKLWPLDEDEEADVEMEADDDVLSADCPQENDYLQECLEVVQQEFMIFNRER